MSQGKIVSSLREAIQLCGLRDGMCVSFHHHLRNGDMVLPLVMQTIADMGYKDIKIFASSVMDGMTKQGLLALVDAGVITGIDCNNADRLMGEAISTGRLKNIAKYRTHGGRPRALMEGEVKVDISFVAASAADCQGNCNGTQGPNAFGAMGYAMTEVKYASKVVVVTDTLFEYPLQHASVSEVYVDYVVKVNAIGDPAGITTGIINTTTRDPIALALAKYAAKAMYAAGLVKDGFAFQSGASGPAIAVAKYLKEYMLRDGVKGSFLLGGASALSVDLVKAGLFETILDVQTFDKAAIESLRLNAWHREISDSEYANPLCRSCAVDRLDTVVLGALEVDTDFNANVCVNSLGYLSGGAGGHGDTAAGAKMSVVVLPTNRGRFPSIVKKVESITTPGKDIDVVVTQYGIAVNPFRPELKECFQAAKLPVKEMDELQRITESLTGTPDPIRYGDRVVAEIVHRDGTVIDRVYQRLDRP